MEISRDSDLLARTLGAPLNKTLAAALTESRQAQEALELQKKAVTLSPTGSGLRLKLAKIALQAGDKELAHMELKALKAAGAALP